MIHILTGDNSYAIKNRLQKLLKESATSANQPPIENLTLSDLSVLLLGENLFSEKQTVILNNLSQRKDIFEPAVNFIIKNKDAINVVLLETSLDKRTIVYKKLATNAKIEDYKQYTDRDQRLLINWLQDYLKEQKITISPKILQELLDWVGPDQERLISAADRLILMNDFTKEGIETYVPKTPSGFAFDLLATAIKKDNKKLNEILIDLKQTQDPYMLMGLLISQLIQAAALTYASSSDNVAKDLAASPYALENIRRQISLTPEQTKQALEIFYSADKAIKTTGAEPWPVVEIALKRLTKI